VPMTRSERALRAKAAGYSRWAKTADRTAATRPGRAAFLSRFAEAADPDGSARQAIDAARAAGKISDAERLQADLERRIEHARKAYMAGLALKSAMARRKAREAAPRKARRATDASS
jgi:hypothetical protein